MATGRGIVVAVAFALLGMGGPACAGPVDDMLQQFEAQGASRFTVAAGEALWERSVTDPKTGEVRRCALCHTTDLRKMGKHATTGKAMAVLFAVVAIALIFRPTGVFGRGRVA